MRVHRQVFPCNNYDNLPRCLHGGRGPQTTTTKLSGRFCICLCPVQWGGPECASAVTLIGKRTPLYAEHADTSHYEPYEFSDDDAVRLPPSTLETQEIFD